MKSTIKNQSKKLLIVAMALGVFATACKTTNPTAPSLPPSSSMNMDNSYSGGQSNKTASGLNCAAAVTAIGWFDLIIDLNVAIPVASFNEAMKHEAVYDANAKEWVWSYNVVVVGITYTANLHASESGDNINWKMVISQQGGFQNFTWYTGVSKKDGTSGTWSLIKSPNANVSFLDIAWNKNSSAGTADTKFTYVEPNQSGTNSYVWWKLTTDIEYNGHYDIYNASNQQLTQIMWNKTNKNGEIISADSTTHCWDNTQQDIICTK